MNETKLNIEDRYTFYQISFLNKGYSFSLKKPSTNDGYTLPMHFDGRSLTSHITLCGNGYLLLLYPSCDTYISVRYSTDRMRYHKPLYVSSLTKTMDVQKNHCFTISDNNKEVPLWG